MLIFKLVGLVQYEYRVQHTKISLASIILSSFPFATLIEFLCDFVVKNLVFSLHFSSQIKMILTSALNY